jgi:hypothetical protein
MRRVVSIFCFLLSVAAPTFAGATASSTVTATVAGAPEVPGLAAPRPTGVPARLEEILAGTDQTGSPPLPPKEASLPPPSAPPGEKRPVPDYDGREDPGTNALEVLAWVPRGLLFPVHLVLEYGVRWPIVGGITFAEKHYLFKRLERVFSFRDGKTLVYPTFFSDFGLNPSVGLATVNQDLFIPGNHLAASVAFWDDTWLRIAGKNDTTFLDDNSGTFTIFGEFLTRPDMPFYGVGPKTRTDDEAFFRERRLEIGARIGGNLGGLSQVSFGSTFRDLSYNERGQVPYLGDEFEARAIPGFDRGGYQLFENRVVVTLDSRHVDTEFADGTGLRAELFGSFEIDPTNNSRNFIRWGGEAAAFWDLGQRHVLAMSLYSEMVEQTGTDRVPFTELPALGGLETMRGYLPRRFVGDSTFSAAASYRYPIWSLLDAELFVGLGNAFDGHYEDFHPDHLYLNGGLSIRTSLAQDTGLTILWAGGTNRLDSDRVRVDSVRFTVGVVQGF